MRRAAAVLAFLVAVAGLACGRPQAFELVAEFADVGDLVTRANVQQRDAVVGTIISIDLDQEADWIARVTMRIEPGTPVPEGTLAVVRSTSLLGEKFVDLVPPPDATAATPQLSDGAVIPVARTDKAPEVEDLFFELGALLASGGLQDLGAFTSAMAMIVEGQEENIGRVFDGTANLVESLSRQRTAIAEALDLLGSSTATLADNTDTIDRFLTTSDGALRLLAEQRGQLDEVLVHLDRLGGSAARLTRAHQQDMDASIKALIEIVPRLFEVRSTLSDALGKLPDFTELFAAAIPGDYVQLDIQSAEPDLPLAAPASAPAPDPERETASLWWEALR